MQKKSFHKSVKVVSIYISKCCTMYLKGWSILQNIDISLHKVDWLSPHYTSARTPLFAAIFQKLETGFSCSRSEVQWGFQMLSTSHKPHPSGEGTIWTDGRLMYQLVLWYIDLKTCCSKDSYNPHKQLYWYYQDVKCKWNLKVRCKM